MKKILVANWKANFDLHQSSEWLKEIRTILEEATIEVVICPDFISIPITASLVKGTSISLGSQDVSQFEKGAFTGEVTTHSLKGLVRYALIGHSERRGYFSETTEVILKKARNATKEGIIPIVCLENASQALSYKKGSGTLEVVFAYEPKSAIGTGQPESPVKASGVLEDLREILGGQARILYGGSVTEKNIRNYLDRGFNGALVSSASLDKEKFVKIVSVLCDTLI